MNLIPISAKNIKKRGPKLIRKLMNHPHWDVPLRKPGCYSDAEVGAVVVRFRYDGKGRKNIVAVKLHPRAMAALVGAMLRVPTIQVTTSFDSRYSGSYRNCAQQKALYDAYANGTGHLAAPPGKSYHQTARAIDCYQVTDRERQVLKDEGFDDLLPQDPPHFTYLARG